MFRCQVGHRRPLYDERLRCVNLCELIFTSSAWKLSYATIRLSRRLAFLTLGIQEATSDLQMLCNLEVIY